MDAGTAAKPGSSGDPQYVITLIHGTWAQDAAWTREGSPLREALTLALGRPMRFERFQWSGANTHPARARAATELRQVLRRLQADYPAAQHYVIAHSHGGNVACYALRGDGPPLRLAGVVCLGTPFVTCVPRRIGLSLDVAAAAARLGVFVAVFLLCALLAYAARSLEMSLGPYHPSIDIVVTIVGAPVAYLVLRVLALGPSWVDERVIFPLARRLRRTQEALMKQFESPPSSGVPFLCIRFIGDEAGLYLRSLQNVSSLPFILWEALYHLEVAILRTGEQLARVHWRILLVPGLARIVAIGQLVLLLTSMVIGAVLVSLWAVMAAVPKLVKAHKLGLGVGSALEHLMVNVTVSQVAPVQTPPPVVVDYHLAAALRRLGYERTVKLVIRRKLIHGLVYEDDLVVRDIAGWMKGGRVLEAGNGEKLAYVLQPKAYKECPSCGLINVASATRCDCGWGLGGLAFKLDPDARASSVMTGCMGYETASLFCSGSHAACCTAAAGIGSWPRMICERSSRGCRRA
jgi:hypothetical protein